VKIPRRKKLVNSTLEEGRKIFRRKGNHAHRTPLVCLASRKDQSERMARGKRSRANESSFLPREKSGGEVFRQKRGVDQRSSILASIPSRRHRKREFAQALRPGDRRGKNFKGGEKKRKCTEQEKDTLILAAEPTGNRKRLRGILKSWERKSQDCQKERKRPRTSTRPSHRSSGHITLKGQRRNTSHCKPRKAGWRMPPNPAPQIFLCARFSSSWGV